MRRLLWFFIPITVGMNIQAAYENTTLNISTSGNTSSGGEYQNIGAIVPLGGQSLRAGTLSHLSGFASGFILQPETAFSGLADELNPDNDLDGLLDDDEVLIGSNLYNPDTDGDGMDDPSEVIAGTSLTNALDVLNVQILSQDSGLTELEWHGKAGRYYQLQYTDDLHATWTSSGSVVSGAAAFIQRAVAGNTPHCYYRILVGENSNEFE